MSTKNTSPCLHRYWNSGVSLPKFTFPHGSWSTVFTHIFAANVRRIHRYSLKTGWRSPSTSMYPNIKSALYGTFAHRFSGAVTGEFKLPFHVMCLSPNSPNKIHLHQCDTMSTDFSTNCTTDKRYRRQTKSDKLASLQQSVQFLLFPHLKIVRTDHCGGASFRRRLIKMLCITG